MKTKKKTKAKADLLLPGLMVRRGSWDDMVAAIARLPPKVRAVVEGKAREILACEGTNGSKEG